MAKSTERRLHPMQQHSQVYTDRVTIGQAIVCCHCGTTVALCKSIWPICSCARLSLSVQHLLRSPRALSPSDLWPHHSSDSSHKINCVSSFKTHFSCSVILPILLYFHLRLYRSGFIFIAHRFCSPFPLFLLSFFFLIPFI